MLTVSSSSAGFGVKYSHSPRGGGLVDVVVQMLVNLLKFLQGCVEIELGHLHWYLICPDLSALKTFLKAAEECFVLRL